MPTGKILKLKERGSHVCEFEIARGGKMGLCGGKPVAIIDDQYFCKECVPDVLMRLQVSLFDDTGVSVDTKDFLKGIKCLK